MKIVKLLFLILTIVGCKYNPNKSNYSPPNVNWTSSDEMPSFENCNDLINESDRKNCFNTKILNLIYTNLISENLIVNKIIDDTLIISFLINYKGKISLIEIENEDKLINEIPDLEKLISNSLENIPSLYPATKTNMGIPVSSKFRLPLIIKSN
ncbi:MAG: hypothetical protein ISP56_03105 [Flavobacteriaceae bacterium]|nr:hypothetical protein [Flavobacteriaceae bacterium]